MFYKLMAGMVVVTFGGVFALSGGNLAMPRLLPGGNAGPQGELVHASADAVYAAMSRAQLRGLLDGSKPADGKGIGVPRAMLMPGRGGRAITWKVFVDKTPIADLTATIVPDGQNARVVTAITRHGLAQPTMMEAMIAAPGYIEGAFDKTLADRIEQFDTAAAAAARVRAQDEIKSSQMVAAGAAIARPDMISRQMNQIGDQMVKMAPPRDSGSGSPPPPVDPNVTIRPGQPMVDPSRANPVD